MGKYFVRAVDPDLVPDSLDWALVDDGKDSYFVCRNDMAVEITLPLLDELVAKVRTYARRGPSDSRNHEFTAGEADGQITARVLNPPDHSG